MANNKPISFIFRHAVGDGSGSDLQNINLPVGSKLVSVQVQTGTPHSGREIIIGLRDQNATSGLVLAHGVQDSGTTNNLNVVWQASNPDCWVLGEWNVVYVWIFGMAASETYDLGVAIIPS